MGKLDPLLLDGMWDDKNRGFLPAPPIFLPAPPTFGEKTKISFCKKVNKINYSYQTHLLLTCTPAPRLILTDSLAPLSFSDLHLFPSFLRCVVSSVHFSFFFLHTPCLSCLSFRLPAAVFPVRFIFFFAWWFSFVWYLHFSEWNNFFKVFCCSLKYNKVV